MPPAITVDGESFGPSAWQQFDWHADWPPRYVTQEPQRFHLQCHRCGTTFPLWMADEAVWKQVPREWWKKMLCLACFRALVPPTTIVRGGYCYVLAAAQAWPKLSLLPRFDPTQAPRLLKAARKFGEDTVYNWIGTLASWYEGYYNLKTVATKLRQWQALTAFMVPPPELPPLLFRGIEIAADKLPAPGTPATIGPEGVAFAGHPGLPTAYAWSSWSESRRVATRFCKGGDAALVRSDPAPGTHGILLQLPHGGAAKQDALLWPGLQQHPELKRILRQAYKVQREWALWFVKRVPIMWELC